MTFVELLPLFMFPALLFFLMLGYPVAFTLAAVGIVFGGIGYFFDAFYLSDFGFIPSRVMGVIENYTLMAVPLFVFMGMVLERSGIAEELLLAGSEIFRKTKGSMAVSVIAVGALLAASTGIVGATVVTMTVLTLPTMLKEGYDGRLAAGTIAASGTLGQIIPPSLVLILLGDVMNVDVGDLFVGAFIPGFVLVSLYILFVRLVAWFKPSLLPPLKEESTYKGTRMDLWMAFIPPLLLIIVVLGAILIGIASPTEAASCGSVGALLIAFMKKKLNKDLLKYSSQETAKITAMVFLILFGAQFFGMTFRGLSGDVTIEHIIFSFEVSPNIILFSLMMLLFFLGFFLDFMEICFIVVPIVLPIMLKLGFNPLWLAVVIAMNLQTSFLTPPFGFALFYLKGSAPPGFKTTTLYQGVIPFILLQLIGLLLVIMFPQLVLWLPKVMGS
ncbi:MAG: TRAP transporter large permease subunit [Oligoflexales bacterium]